MYIYILFHPLLSLLKLEPYDPVHTPKSRTHKETKNQKRLQNLSRVLCIHQPPTPPPLFQPSTHLNFKKLYRNSTLLYPICPICPISYNITHIHTPIPPNHPHPSQLLSSYLLTTLHRPLLFPSPHLSKLLLSLSLNTPLFTLLQPISILY